MPRLPAIPLKGTFDSNSGIYTFDGHSYKARWYANALKMPINDCKLIVEQGHKENHVGLPQAVLVVGKSKWEQIAKSYASWVGLTMFHYYDSTVNPGELPPWLSSIKAHGTKLIHEIAPGVVYLLTYCEPNAMYRYFIDAPPAPVYTQPLPGPVNPTPPAFLPTLTELEITGSIGDKDINLLLKLK